LTTPVPPFPELGDALVPLMLVAYVSIKKIYTFEI